MSGKHVPQIVAASYLHDDWTEPMCVRRNAHSESSGNRVKPVRVLLIRNCRGITAVTGGEAYLLSLMSVVDEAQCRFRLICLTNPEAGETPWLRELENRDLPFETVPVPHRASLRDVLDVPRKIHAFDADIVHCMDHRSDVVGVLAAKVTGRPAIAWFGGWTNFSGDAAKWRLYTWADRQALARMQAVIVDSPFLARQLDLGPCGPPVVAIPNGVDLAKLDPDRISGDEEHRFPDAPGRIVLGTVGRIHPNKAQLDFVEAAAALVETNPACRFVICGDAPPGFEHYKSELLDLISKRGLEEHVRVFAVPSSEIPRVLAGIDVVVSPCDTESCSFAVLEGMAMRKPVVAADAGGNPDLIVDGETGILVAPRDWRALKAGVASLLKDGTLRERLGRNARREIQARFTLEMMGSRTLQVYREVLAAYRTRRGRTASNDELKRRLSQIGVFVR